MFSLVYFSIEVCLVGMFPHSVSTRRDPCIRVYVPLTLPTPLTRKQNRRGDRALYLSQARGAFELTHWSACIIGWKSGLLDILISPYIAQFMGCVIGRIHWPYSRILFLTFYCLPLSSWCKTAHRRWANVNASKVYLVEVCLTYC